MKVVWPYARRCVDEPRTTGDQTDEHSITGRTFGTDGTGPEGRTFRREGTHRQLLLPDGQAVRRGAARRRGRRGAGPGQGPAPRRGPGRLPLRVQGALAADRRGADRG